MAAILPLNRAGARASARLFGFGTPLLLCAIAGLTTAAAPAQSAPPTPAISRAAEMPELAGPGAMAIGTETLTLARGHRIIDVTMWYPSAPEARSSEARGLGAVYRHTFARPGSAAVELAEPGRAVFQAAPAGSGHFPLVLISHGYGGWGTHMSRLGEALASHGYVVASIDHRDRAFTDGASFVVSFSEVLGNRAGDQRAVLHALLGDAAGSSPLIAPRLAALIDKDAVGVIGYSMGGYGALTVAGAAVDPQAPAFAPVPAAARGALAEADPALSAKIKAVVAIAPWGAQPGSAVWTDAGLAQVTAPLLLIDGDQDDVADFSNGVSRVFAAAKGAERYLLVFREAAHNVAGNPIALPADAGFGAIENASDPVWRKDRIEGIDEHFIRAFFDQNLKHDAGAARYLNVPVPQSDAGTWPSAFGQQWGGTYAGDAQPAYWRGFQRRWAAGLELHHKRAGE